MSRLSIVLYSLVSICLLIIPFTKAEAADPNLFEAATHQSNGQSIPYRLFHARQNDRQKLYPLILFLHGSGERGDNNTSQVKHNFPSVFLSKQGQNQRPCFIVAPQCPKGVSWSGDRLVQLKSLIDSLCEEYPIDRKRLYLTGLSMGGRGTFNMLAEYPGLFAAAVSCAGGNDPSKVKEMMQTPMWLHCSSADRSINYYRDLVKALNDLDEEVVWFKSRKDWTDSNVPWEAIENKARNHSRFLFCEISDGQHHNSWTFAWENPEMPSWLFSKSLSK